MKKNNNTTISNNPMPAKSIRLREDQWTFIQNRHQEFGAENPNAFIRDAVDFYTEWLTMNRTQKFLTPALESVITAKVRDCEERLSRIVFKLATSQNMLAHIAGNDYNWSEDEIEELRVQCVRELKESNGTLGVPDIYARK